MRALMRYGDGVAAEQNPSTGDSPERGVGNGTGNDTGNGGDPDTAIESIAVLGEESRRQMYTFIRRVRRPVTRDEAAASVGISRKLAAFHLDKLVAAGLLRISDQPPGGIRKVGRRPKAYTPAEEPIQLSIPARRHEVLASILMDAVLTEGQDERAPEAAVRAARERGRRLGAQERERRRPGRLGIERGLTVCERVLEEHGFEPGRETPTTLRLRNCPFHPLATTAPDLVCGMNHAYLGGLVEGLEVHGVQASLAPRPDECCVELHSSPGP